METLFYKVLTAGFHGSIVILAVLLLRLVLRRTPRKFICILWLMAFLRLLVPIEIHSEFSIQPRLPETLPVAAEAEPRSVEKPESEAPGLIPVEQEPVPAIPEISHSVSPMFVTAWVWAVGMVLVWGYGLFSYWHLKARVREAWPAAGAYASDRIGTAFVLGYFSPKIYIPAGISPEDLPYVLAHEQTHLQKGDPWAKLFGFLALSVHWMNPLVFLAFLLFGRDTELACDEHVVQFMDLEERKKYAAALVNCSVSHRHLAAFPVAFGEISVKERVLSVLKAKKPGFWIRLLGVLAIAFVGLCLMTQPGKAAQTEAPADAPVGTETPGATEESAWEGQALWVVTEATTADGMNGEARRIAEEFEGEYPGIYVNIDVLPTEKQEREEALAVLRQAMDQGKGPDLFLLPTRNVLTLDEPQQYTYQRVRPLFSNVDMAMRHGEFLDVTDLLAGRLEGLHEKVLEAGTVKGRQYVIPLRYNVPVIYCYDKEVHSLGMEPEHFDQPFPGLMDQVLRLREPQLACGAEYRSLLALGQALDYDREKVLLDEYELNDFLTRFQELESLIGPETGHRNRPWLMNYVLGELGEYPARMAQLDSAPAMAAIAKLEGKSLSMHPVRDRNGEVTATVTYYGAVGRDTRNADLSVKFLLKFLEEESQFETARAKDRGGQYPGLLEQSWPVRSRGAVAALWKNLKWQVSGNADKELQALELSDKDVPALDLPIERAVFPLNDGSSFDAWWPALTENNPDLENLNRLELAKEILRNLNQELIYP